MSKSVKALLALLLAACDDGVNDAPPNPNPPLVIPAGCQPLLGGFDCLLPYPSDFFRVEDAASPTGFRIELSESAKIDGSNGKIDPHGLHPSDGFSQVPTIAAILPDAVALDGLVGVLSNPEQSLLLSSPTLLIEARTGQLIPHFTDLDARDSAPEKTILIRPLVPLQPEARYVVALHNVKNTSGVDAAPAKGFARLRDKQTAEIPALAALQETFESQVFSVTDTLGVSRQELQLAFTFTTRSQEAPRVDMLRVRELTLEFLAQNTPQISDLTVQRVDDDPLRCQIIRGKVTGPLFLSSFDTEGTFTRDGSGQITQNGTASFGFTAIVPRSVCDATTPARMLTFGHGFFFEADLQLSDDTSHTIANNLGVVMLGIDWFGMSFDDGAATAVLLTSDPNQALRFTDRVHQGMANWLTMLRAIKGPLLQQPEFQRASSDPLYDADPLSFLGISQGHILGSILGALSPDLERVGLHVGGAGFTHIMSRARPFNLFLQALAISVDSSRDQQKMVALLQEGFDRIDPATYAELLLESPLAGSPADRRVLFQSGLGDSEVPNLGNFLHARMLGLPVLSPSPLPVFGLSSVEGPVDGSAVVLYDFGLDLVDIYQTPDPNSILQNGVHENLRLEAAVQSQWDAFYQRDSQIINFCDGVCDPD